MTVPSGSAGASSPPLSGASTRGFATQGRMRPAAAMTRRLLRGRQDAGLAEEARDRVGRLGALAQPLRRLLGVDLDVHGVRARVVVADRVERATVAGVAAGGGGDAGGGVVCRAAAAGAD